MAYNYTINMKNALCILFIFFMVSCAAAFRVVADLGMEEREFTRINPGAELVEMHDNIKIYRVIHGAQPAKYVYFEKGILVRMDEGQMMYSKWNPFLIPTQEY